MKPDYHTAATSVPRLHSTKTALHEHPANKQSEPRERQIELDGDGEQLKNTEKFPLVVKLQERHQQKKAISEKFTRHGDKLAASGLGLCRHKRN